LIVKIFFDSLILILPLLDSEIIVNFDPVFTVLDLKNLIH